jgi:glycerophosphoryl diester phosphodiesterase
MAIPITKPTVGGDDDTWGTKLNVALDALSTAVPDSEKGAPGGVAGLDSSGNLTVNGGGTFTAPVTVGTPTATGHAVTKAYADGLIFPAPLTVTAWEASKGTGYAVAHRGSGDLIPENTIEGFDYAYQAGARIAEVSVCQTADGVLILHHDLTYDRATNISGTIVDLPSSVLGYARVKGLAVARSQGPAWDGTQASLGFPPLKVPLFEDILRRFGGRMILMCEAKHDAAYPAMVAMIEKYGLQKSVMIKAFWTSSRIAQAKAAGYKVYSYFGSDSDNTPVNLGVVVAAGVDYLAISGYTATNTVIAASQVTQAVAASPNMKIWAYPIHRRVDRDFFYANGAEGIIASNYGYLAGNTAITKRDAWESFALAPGELTQDPTNTSWALTWIGDPGLGAVVQEKQNITPTGGSKRFFCLGQCSPIAAAASTYTIDVDFQWVTIPTDTTQNITVAFGRADDSYYEHQLGKGNGYHAIIRPNRNVQLFTHVDGSTSGTQIGTTGVLMTANAVAATWYHAKITVTPTTITFTVNDGTDHVVTATDSTRRGGYFHLGCSQGEAAWRNLVIT